MIHLIGKAAKCNMDLSGSFYVHAFGFPVHELSCKMSGSIHAEMNVEDTLRVNLLGSGCLKYKGSPKIVKECVHELVRILQAE